MSDWSKVTRPIPVPNEWTKPFWDAAKRGVLELQRCQSCGHFQHPPYATCTQCVSTDLKFEPVRGAGAIYAYTIMYHTGDKRFASAVPYASIIVELDDAPGALLAGNLLEAEYTEAKVGRRVEVVFEKLNDDITLPQFRLARTRRPSEGEGDMWENRCKVAVSGVGFSKVTRSADIPLAAHALTAVKEAVADSGLQMSDIDGLATYPELPATGHAEVDGISIVSVNCMMAMLKLPNLGWHIQVGTTNIGGAVQQAVNALLAGVCKYAVVWRAMHNPRGTYQNLPSGMAAGATQFTAPYGFGGPGQGMAVAYTRWLERNNQNREKMATLAVTQRRHTQHNPHAYFYGTELTREDYLNSRMVAYPFCLFDCDIPVQGAVAIVLTTADRARDLKPRPAYLAGYGQRLHFEVAGRIGSLSSYMEGGSSSAKLTWERSGFGPKDVDVAQIYDGFSASVIYGLESYGFCGEGEALDFIQDGRIELDGELPLNTFGGSLGTGRIHGLWHIIEGALQASGRAGSRQVKDANVSFVGASAPIVTGTTFIFVREPY